MRIDQHLENQIREARRAMHGTRWTNDMVLGTSVALVALIIGNGYLIPSFVPFPLTLAVIAAGCVTSLLTLRDLRREKYRRAEAKRASEFLNEPLPAGAFAKTEVLQRLALICLAVGAFQGWLEVTSRPDVRKSFPALGRFLDAGPEDIAVSVLDHKSNTSRPIKGTAPSTLTSRETLPVTVGSDLYVWPSNPNAPNLIATLTLGDGKEAPRSEALAWKRLETEGAIPTFRYNPDTVLMANLLHVWGGFLDPPNVNETERRPLMSGASLDLKTRQWKAIPEIPKIKGANRARLIGRGNEILVVATGVEAGGRSGWLRVQALGENGTTWRSLGGQSLPDFFPRNLRVQRGLILLDGARSLNSPWMMQVNDTAQQLLTVIGAGKTQMSARPMTSSSNLRAFRYDDKSTSGSLALVPQEVPPLMSGAEVLAELPGLLVLADVERSLVICRVNPLECDMPRDGQGNTVRSTRQTQWVGLLEGTVARIWDRQNAQRLSYDFVTRSLSTVPLVADALGSDPLVQVSNTLTLAGRRRAGSGALEDRIRSVHSAVSCSLLPSTLLGRGPLSERCNWGGRSSTKKITN